jgi:hypothetical protein
MITRRQAIALAAVLTATTVTGGVAVVGLARHGAQAPVAHAVQAPAPSPAPPAPPIAEDE